MASTVVFKVKYEDTLRRFNARVVENQLVELDIAGLRAKIRSLFNFTADADLKLTYVDEDHDMVDLIDEEDLHDVVKQALDPVRITVKLNTAKTASTFSSGFSTPVPPQGQTSNLDMNAGFADLLKSVPQPLRESLSKLSAEAASKAASSSPILADLVESFTKLAQSLNAHPSSQSAPADLAGEAAPRSNGAEASDAVNATKPVDESAAFPCRYSLPMRDQKKLLAMQALECRRRSQCDERKKAGLLDDCVKRHEMGSSSGQETAVPAVSKHLQRVPMTPLPGPWFPTAQHGPVFHKGVQCDVCGVHPIAGSRFKSKVKEDYDLCISCFKLTGNDADYERIDVAAPHRHPWAFKGNRAGHHPWAHPHHPLQPLFPVSGKQKPVRPKLDSRFIMDVNVMDGTVMAPKTAFTKIWRMRNSGNIPWVSGFQLVWIGGDKFSNTDSVQIELPAGGYLLPDGEVEVAVEFTAPELPGRYISYWKVAAPSGLKIGQRVWVLIQVDATIKDASSAAPGGLNLNLPPPQAVSGDGSAEAADMNVEPLVDFHYEPAPVDEPQNMLNLPEVGCYFQPPLMAPYPTHQVSMPEAIPAIRHFSNASPANHTALYPTVDPPSRSLFHPSLTAAYPLVDPSPPAATSAEAPPPTTDVPAGSAATQEAAIDVAVGKSAPPDSSSTGHNAVSVGQPIPVEVSGHNVEAALLNDLAEMGFKQTNLNKLVLKRNDYDLESSLDELCNASEWDLLLEELQGMGFVDREMNEKALSKNNGSIKHAVMDLISRENA